MHSCRTPGWSPKQSWCAANVTCVCTEDERDTVQKSGVKFEASIRKRESSNPRFAFLLPGNRFHAYYRHVPLAASDLDINYPCSLSTLPTPASAQAALRAALLAAKQFSGYLWAQSGGPV